MDKNQANTPEEQPRSDTPTQPTRRNKNSLLVYVAVMFAIAFLLVLFSFLSQQRASNQTISTLSQTSATAVGRVQELEDAYTSLSREHQELTDQVEELTQALTRQQEAYDALTETRDELADQLAQAQTETADARQSLEQATQELETLRQDRQDLTDRLALDTLLEQGARAALGLDYDTLAQILAQIDPAALDASQQALYAQLQQKLTLGSSTEQG